MKAGDEDDGTKKSCLHRTFQTEIHVQTRVTNYTPRNVYEKIFKIKGIVWHLSYLITYV